MKIKTIGGDDGGGKVHVCLLPIGFTCDFFFFLEENIEEKSGTWYRVLATCNPCEGTYGSTAHSHPQPSTRIFGSKLSKGRDWVRDVHICLLHQATFNFNIILWKHADNNDIARRKQIFFIKKKKTKDIFDLINQCFDSKAIIITIRHTILSSKLRKKIRKFKFKKKKGRKENPAHITSHVGVGGRGVVFVLRPTSPCMIQNMEGFSNSVGAS